MFKKTALFLQLGFPKRGYQKQIYSFIDVIGQNISSGKIDGTGISLNFAGSARAKDFMKGKQYKIQLKLFQHFVWFCLLSIFYFVLLNFYKTIGPQDFIKEASASAKILGGCLRLGEPSSKKKTVSAFDREKLSKENV